MRLISFALATSTAILARDTNTSRTRGSTVTNASLPAIFRSSVGNHNDVVVKRLLRAREIAADEERMPTKLPSFDKVISELFATLHVVETYPPDLGKKIINKLLTFDREAIKHYYEKQYEDPIMATKKLIEASSLKHERTHGPFDMEMYREFYHDHLQKETRISHWVQDGLDKVELHPNVVFKMMINAKKRPVLGADSRSLFATTDLKRLNTYIKRFNQKEKSRTPASLRQTLSYCIRDEAGLASFLSIAKQNSINAPFVWKEQHRLFMGWIGHRKTIDQVADMMKIPGQWKDAKACPFLDTLIGYVTVFAQTYPAASTDIVSCLVIKFGHLYAAMLIEEAKEVNIDVFAELEKVLFQSWTKGGTNPLNFDQADFFAEITVGADDKALIREHFAEHYRKETPSHLMLTLN